MNPDFVCVYDPDRPIRNVLASARSSYALRRFLELSIDRDPVDAVKDARALFELLEGRLEAIQRSETGLLCGK